MQLKRPDVDSGNMRRLPLIAKLSLAREILVTYLRVRWVLRGRELPQAVAILREPPARRRRELPLADGERYGERLGAAVVRTLTLLPADSRCLMRSLVLLAVLARRRVQGSLVIAVRPPRAERLNAHAWVELGGRPLLEPGTVDFARLLTL